MKTENHSLFELNPANHVPQASYGKLPNEAAYNLIAELHERAIHSHRPFNIKQLSLAEDSSGFCLGITHGQEAIAVFYVSEYGQYAWCFVDSIHVVQPAQARHMTPLPLEIGEHYWFRKSQSRPDAICAMSVGPIGPLRTHYVASHTPVPKTASKKAKFKDGDSDAGLPPALRPKDNEQVFVPLKSLDELGL